MLENREIKEDLEDHKEAREELAKKRMELASLNRTDDWTMEELTVVLKGLKTNKSRDALGYLNELFKPEVIGDDLKLAILKLMDRIKTKTRIS